MNSITNNEKIPLKYWYFTIDKVTWAFCTHEENCKLVWNNGKYDFSVNDKIYTREQIFEGIPEVSVELIRDERPWSGPVCQVQVFGSGIKQNGMKLNLLKSNDEYPIIKYELVKFKTNNGNALESNWEDLIEQGKELSAGMELGKIAYSLSERSDRLHIDSLKYLLYKVREANPDILKDLLKLAETTLDE